MALVDALARLQLAARRLGCSVRLRGACAELTELLELVGLDAELVVEVVGETEGGEEIGVEEGVEAGDPVA